MVHGTTQQNVISHKEGSGIRFQFYLDRDCRVVKCVDCETKLFIANLFIFAVKMPPKQRKIALMGSRSVGKSSLAIQFAQVIMIVKA